MSCILTSGHCGGCEAVFFSFPITQHCSHSDGVLSALLQAMASHCVHSLATSNISDDIRVSETLSVCGRVRDVVTSNCHTIIQY